MLAKVVLFILFAQMVRRGPNHLRDAVLAGLAFAVVNYYVYHMIEGFDNPSTKTDEPCPGADGMYVKCPSGDCHLKTDKHSPCPQ